MLVFISWSGVRSKQLAVAIANWLAVVVTDARPWVSAADLDPAKRWQPEIARQLAAAGFGVACVTPENTHAPWLLFEAGALAKSDNLVPLLLGVEPEHLPSPLKQFQSLRVAKCDLFRLAQAVNKFCGSPEASGERVTRACEATWLWLEHEIKAIPETEMPIPPDSLGVSNSAAGGPLTKSKEVPEKDTWASLLAVLERELASTEVTLSGYDSLVRFINERSGSTIFTSDLEEQHRLFRYRRSTLLDCLSRLRPLQHSGYVGLES